MINKRCWVLDIVHIAVDRSEFPRREGNGAPTPKWVEKGCQRIIWPIFSKTCSTMKRSELRVGSHPLRPLKPPMHCMVMLPLKWQFASRFSVIMTQPTRQKDSWMWHRNMASSFFSTLICALIPNHWLFCVSCRRSSGLIEFHSIDN